MGRTKVNVEFDLGLFLALQRREESGIAILKHREKGLIRRVHAHRHAPDFNHEAETRNVDG
jgi:hypothetical protein